MPDITPEQMTEAAITAAAEIAAKLNMQREENITDSWDGRPIMIANSKGIQMGTLTIKNGEMRTYSYTNYKLHDELLATEKYAITEYGFSNEATIDTFTDEDTIIYAGY